MSKQPQPGYAAGNILNLLVQLGADLTGAVQPSSSPSDECDQPGSSDRAASV